MGPILRRKSKTIPETNSNFAPENGWLENTIVSCYEVRTIFRRSKFEVGNVMTFTLFGFYEVFVGLSVMIDDLILKMTW